MKTKKLSKQRLIDLGGAFWSKNNIERVYLNNTALTNLLVLNNKDLNRFNFTDNMKNAVTYYDVNVDQLITNNIEINKILWATGFDCAAPRFRR